MLNIVMFGAPGSGKGTQSEVLIKTYGLFHISTGDVLRDHIKRGTALGKTAQEYINQGQLIPDELMVNILASVMDDNKDAAAKGVIFDGFPRTVEQAEALTGLLKKYNMEAVMLDMIVDEQEVITRLINRGKTSGRADDNEETIKKRLEVYHRQTQPVATYYLHQDNYFAINGNNTMEDVFAQICHIIDLFM